MPKVTESTREEIKETIVDFLAEECEIDASELTEDTNIIKDIEGDSLMFLELLEIFKKKYQLDIELKVIGKYVVKHPVETIKQLIDTTILIIEHENDISALE